MLDQKKWLEMSLAQQLGNIGSEISKAFYWDKKDKAMAQETAGRALELFDLTISDKRWRSKIKEIFKMRSIFCDTFFNLGNFKVSQKSIEEYFIPFAILANKNRFNETAKTQK